MEDFPAGPPAIAGDRTPGRSLMPRAAEPVSHNEGHTLSLQLEGALTQQRRPNTAKKKQFINRNRPTGDPDIQVQRKGL